MWPMPAVVCTAHTVLGLMENVRRGIYAWPSIARSAFVFDEIHSYSDRMFSYLLRFLSTFRGSPVLLMTATLPPRRRRELAECCSSRNGLETIEGPKDREMAKRYIVRKTNVSDAWEEVELLLKQRGKVLWVVNTVKRAMSLVTEAQNRKLPVQPYHSRYAYRDRLVRHRTVIDGFGRGEPAMLAITTQVAEMSLDLSADLLVSELAPVPAMIQRMGRLNRFAEIPEKIASVLFMAPESPHPYHGEELEAGEQWVNSLADGEAKSQDDLAHEFVRTSSANDKPDESAAKCEWLDGLWSSRKDVRAIEEAGYTIEVVRQEDLARVS
jgi:CRISPR-associated endonuclease/helicase Cas3